jgi:prepilin-type N-terminal cleavage/methylation domain-containing protein/prepilin-type processing-associated H-X9-DG protein
MRTRRRGAFSLVELLVVIGIIAVLISLLMPTLNKARAQALSLKCQSQMRTIGQAMLMYANDNRGWLFPSEQGLDVPINERWFIYVLKPTPPVDQNSTNERDWTPPILLCPADDPEPVYYHSYLVNRHLYEHNVRYSSKPPGGIDVTRAVAMGEKQTNLTNYYVEILGNRTTYYDQVEKYRHGRQLASNYLYLDLHVDHNGPIDIPPGDDAQNPAQDPWDFPGPRVNN